MTAAPGDILGGRYRVLSFIAAGGMGEVLRCRDLEQGRDVAAKRIRPELVAEPYMARMFHTEVYALARLAHPAIASVLDYLSGGDGPILIMEHRRGEPLSRLVPPRLPWRLAVDIAGQLLDVLAYEHARGIVHCDVKAQNILVDRAAARPAVTLLDFGIARVRAERGKLDDGLVAGTPASMAPEQLLRNPIEIGPWTDLYSLGLLLYEMLSGRHPFPDTDRASVLRRLNEPAPPLDAPDAPGELAALCARLLERDPARRPFVAADVREVLRRIAEDAPPPAWGVVDPAEAEQAALAPTVLALPLGAAMPVSAPRASLSAPGVEEARVTSPPAPGAYGLYGMRELPLLGREAERDMLRRAIETSAGERRATVVVIRGEAGVGKTRLAKDALEWAVERGRCIAIRTWWSPDGAAGHGARLLLEDLLDARGAPAAEGRARLDFWLRRVPGHDHERYRREAELFAWPPPDVQGDPGLPLRVAVDSVARAARLRPTVALLLDDAQWSGGEAALLVDALRRRADLPVCVIVTVREGEARSDDVIAAGVEAVRLPTLDAQAMRQFLRGHLHVDDALEDALVSRADGNPLFAAEMLRDLVAASSFERREGRYRLRRPLDPDMVPTNVAALWDRRIAGAAAGRGPLQALAMLGEPLAPELVRRLAELLPGVDLAVERGLAAGLIRSDSGAYRFVHGLLREHLLRTVAAEDLAELSGAAADALAPVAANDRDRIEDHARLLAGAGRGLAACQAMLAAAEWSQRRADPVSRRRRLLTLIDWAARNDLADLEARGRADLAYLDSLAGAAADAQRGLDAARALVAGTTGRAAAWVAYREAQVASSSGRSAEAIETGGRAWQMAREQDEAEVERRALIQIATDVQRKGDLGAARELLHRAADLSRSSADRVAEAQVLMLLAAVVKSPAEGLSFIERAIELAHETGATVIELNARQVGADLWRQAGDHERARREARWLAEEAERRSLRQLGSLAAILQAAWALLDGDAEEARARHADAVRWGARTGAIMERALLRAVDAGLAVGWGDTAAALAAVRDLDGFRGDFDDPLLRGMLDRAAERAASLDPELASLLQAAARGPVSRP